MENHVDCYRLVVVEDKYEFEAQCEDMLKRGWKLIGGASSNGKEFIQAFGSYRG